MQRFLAALILAFIVIGVPLVAKGLFVAANVSVWAWRLKRRIGEAPAEAFVPEDVLSGLEPIGAIGILVMLVGFGLLLAGYLLASGFLLGLGEVLAFVPGLYLLLLLVNWMWSGGLAANEGERCSRVRPEREAKIAALSQWLEEHPNDTSLLCLYRRFWRAAHRTEFLKEAFLLEKELDTDLVRAIESDLDYVASNPSAADRQLVADAASTRGLAERFAQLIKKDMAKRLRS